MYALRMHNLHFVGLFSSCAQHPITIIICHPSACPQCCLFCHYTPPCLLPLPPSSSLLPLPPPSLFLPFPRVHGGSGAISVKDLIFSRTGGCSYSKPLPKECNHTQD